MKQLFYLGGLICILTLTVALTQKSKPLFPQAPGMQTYTFRNSMKKDVAATLDSIKVWE